MKNSIFALSLAALVTAGFAQNAAAQRYDTRRDVPAIINADRARNGEYRGEEWEQRSRLELDRLNADVADLRREIGGLRDNRIRDRFHNVRRATDQLNYAINHHELRGGEARKRIQRIRGELDEVRSQLRARYGRLHGR